MERPMNDGSGVAALDGTDHQNTEAFPSSELERITRALIKTNGVDNIAEAEVDRIGGVPKANIGVTYSQGDSPEGLFYLVGNIEKTIRYKLGYEKYSFKVQFPLPGHGAVMYHVCDIVINLNSRMETD